MLFTLENIIPQKIKVFFYKIFLRKLKEKNKKQSSQIPRIELNNVLISNSKLLLDRETLLQHLPKNGVVAELGVDQGDFSKLILEISQPTKLHLIDFWGSSRYNQDKRTKVENRFDKKIKDGKVEINLGFSTDVGNEFEDSYFDWIYIDTDHSYQTTKRELEIWSKKIKPDGVIAGHDFIIGNWDGIVRYGVIEAVYEFCVENNWELIYLTMELNIHPSFAIRKIH